MKSCRYGCQGFTLIELSIVMIIIGLVLGGVTAGRDLIKASELRAAASQIEEYQIAVYTFKNKYDALPGDIKAAHASQIGLSDRTGGRGNGDGNSLLETCTSNVIAAGCETILFWADLAATVIDTGTSGTVSANSVMQLTWNVEHIITYLNPIQSAHAVAMPPIPVNQASSKNDVLPESKLGNSNSIFVFSVDGNNFFQIAGVDSTDADGVYDLFSAISPEEAHGMDTKIDDSAPYTGKMVAMEGSVANTLADANTSPCIFADGSKYYYNTSTKELSSTRSCQLRIAMK
ncbi:MAG: pilus assembly FimT family protein [Rickettsiales bacterium]